MRKLVAVLASAALVSAACGADDATGPEAPSTPAAEGTPSPQATPGGSPGASPSPDGTPPVALAGPTNDHGTGQVSDGRVDMELDDFYFDPTFVSAQPGAQVTVNLRNEGDVSHTFTIASVDVDEVVEPGAEGQATLTLPASGPVEFICRFHDGQGMRGAFYFEGS